MSKIKCNEMTQRNGMFRLTLIVDEDGNGTVIDSNQLNVNDFIDCSTAQIKEIKIKSKQKKI